MKHSAFVKASFSFALTAFLAACSSGLQDPNSVTEHPSAEIELTPLAATVSHSVPDGASDAEEYNDGDVFIGSEALELGYSSIDSTTPQTVGVRFLGVGVPKGAQITNAYLEFEAGTTSSGTASFKIVGQDVASGGPFVNGGGSTISSRLKTSAQVTWNPSAWTYGELYRTTNLASIVEEITSRSDWQQGAAMVFIIDGTGFRRAPGFEHATLAPAKLVVTYDSPPPNNTWSTRLSNSLTSGRYTQASDDDVFNPDHIAAGGDLYHISRNANMVVTSWFLAYRETGNNTFIYYVDRFMDQLKAAVGNSYHPNGEPQSFREILYKKSDGEGSEFYMTDEKELDEMLGHGFIASMTLALRDAGQATGNTSYTSTANWWLDYLQDDFEAKWEWREANNENGGELKIGLTHPRANYIRFYYAMYKLTNQSSYLAQAQSEVTLLKQTIRSNGWSHYIGETSGCAPVVYVPLTVVALVDLASNGSNLLDTATMQRSASTIRGVLNDPTGIKIADNSCGTGREIVAGKDKGRDYVRSYTLTPIAAWDSTGYLEDVTETIYSDVESNTSNPIGTIIPASMAFSTLY